MATRTLPPSCMQYQAICVGSQRVQNGRVGAYSHRHSAERLPMRPTSGSSLADPGGKHSRRGPRSTRQKSASVTRTEPPIGAAARSPA